MKRGALDAARFLIVPGFHGSGPDHWQSWLEQQVPNSTRITGIDFEQPVLAQWAARIREELAQAREPLWLIAHSFGSLAAVVAAADRPEHIAQLILVAPADPDRFDCMGLKQERSLAIERFTLGKALPLRPLQVNGLVIASRDDPWLPYEKAAALASAWQLDLHDAGAAGHINADTGYGAWPALLTLLRKHSRLSNSSPVVNTAQLRKGRGSALAAVRQLTREQLQSPQDHRLWQ